MLCNKILEQLADTADATLQESVMKKVSDEFVNEEENEVKVIALGVFEDCPDQNLSEECSESLRKFVLVKIISNVTLPV